MQRNWFVNFDQVKFVSFASPKIGGLESRGASSSAATAARYPFPAWGQSWIRAPSSSHSVATMLRPPRCRWRRQRTSQEYHEVFLTARSQPGRHGRVPTPVREAEFAGTPPRCGWRLFVGSLVRAGPPPTCFPGNFKLYRDETISFE